MTTPTHAQDVLRMLIRKIGSPKECDALPYSERVRNWAKRDTFIVACLYGFVRALDEIQPPYNPKVVKTMTAAVNTFLADAALWEKIERLAAEITLLEERQTILRCLLKHDSTFREMAVYQDSLWDSVSAGWRDTPPPPFDAANG